MSQYFIWSLCVVVNLVSIAVIYCMLAAKIKQIGGKADDECKSVEKHEATAYRTPEELSECDSELHDYTVIDDYNDMSYRFMALLKERKLYLDPDVKIQVCADMLHTNKTYLSRAINFVNGMNFNRIVNIERVKEAMSLFAENPDMKITELCRASGFKSMTTFNTAFSRTTGKTPAEWCKSYKNKIKKNADRLDLSEEKASQE